MSGYRFHVGIQRHMHVFVFAIGNISLQETKKIIAKEDDLELNNDLLRYVTYLLPRKEHSYWLSDKSKCSELTLHWS